MKRYDAKCPVCGTVNHGVYLEETNGWMECERCGSLVEMLRTTQTVAIPVLTDEHLKAIVAHAV